MEAICSNCEFKLNIPKAAMPAGTRLFCPKCKGLMKINEDAPEQATPRRTQQLPKARDVAAAAEPLAVEPHEAAPIELHDHDGVVSSELSAAPGDRLLDDLVPEFEMKPAEPPPPRPQQHAEEEIQVEIETPVEAPPPMQPPKIPSGGSEQKGYIKATSSIQVDSAMFSKGDSSKAPKAQKKNVAQKVAEIEKKSEASASKPPVKPAVTTADRTWDEPVVPARKPHHAAVYIVAAAVIVVSAVVFWVVYGLAPAKVATPAAKAATEASKQTPAQEHYSVGNQHFDAQRYELAAEEYRMAVLKDDKFALAYRSLGATYGKLGKSELAVKYYEQYLKFSPGAQDAAAVKKIVDEYNGK